MIQIVSSSICFLSYYSYQGYFLVLVGKIKRFLLEKLRMELKYHHYDVTFLVYSTIQKDILYGNILSVMLKTTLKCLKF
jgi:hypothetical protein